MRAEGRVVEGGAKVNSLFDGGRGGVKSEDRAR